MVPVALIARARASFPWGGGWEGLAAGFALLIASGMACVVPFALGTAAMIRGTEKPARALLAATVPPLVVSFGWISA